MSLAPPVVLDLGIAFSISGDEPAKMLEAEKEFVKKLLLSFKISGGETLVGFMKYGRESKIVNKLGEIRSKTQVDRAVDEITLGVPGTNILSLFKRSRTQFFRPIYGARDNVPKSLLLFIGDKSGILQNDLTEEAEQLRQMGIKLVVVGMGKDVDLNEIEALGTNPDAFFFPENLPALQMNLEPVTKELMPGL